MSGAPAFIERTTVAYHAGKDIPRGTLRNILRQAQLTIDEFLSLP